MKHYLIGLLLLCSCGKAPIRPSNEPAAAQNALYYAGGDGSSIEQAVTFPGAKSSSEGVPLEYQWVREHFAGAKRTRQGTLTQGDRRYDVLYLHLPDGAQTRVYFDITDWFGAPKLGR